MLLSQDDGDLRLGVQVITERQPEWMKSPSLGTYVYDFGQNEPGWWCVSPRVSIWDCLRLAKNPLGGVSIVVYIYFSATGISPAVLFFSSSKLKITGQRGLTVQLRHAEVLQHPPYGPADGNIYVQNLRSAKATDTYILKGDPAGEEVAFSFTQHVSDQTGISSLPHYR